MIVTCADRPFELPKGATGKDLAEQQNRRGPSQALAIVINGIVRDLSTPLDDGDSVELLDFDDPRGREVFWHSCAHVLAQAVVRLWPEAKPTIGPPIANGFYYDFANVTFTESDFDKLEGEIARILKENFKLERYVFRDKDEALERFSDNPYKLELIRQFEGPISAYRQGEFFDLCRGPHLPSLGKIKAFKVVKTAGAYWRGNSDNEMLCRIYGIAFPDRKQLKTHLKMLDEAKKRDHKILGPKLDLFTIEQEGPGMPLILPHGMVVWNHLVDFLRQLQSEAGYKEIKTPHLLNQELWERSGHWEFYRESMYHFEIEKRHFAIKPMNCPGCMLYFKGQNHSYRELPVRISELGHVHRHEPSGALSGLFRVRSFHQDDAHIFMRPQDIKGEILGILQLVEKVYGTFGLAYRCELSTRPKKSIGSDAEWERATSGLKSALDEYGLPYQINDGDGAFYGPKIDIHIRDALDRSWQCGTIQLDMSLPEKFALTYMDCDGVEKRPVMIHRALFGSVERFFGILIEHFAGKFPLWISPRQVRLIPVADRHLDYARAMQRVLQEAGIACEIDDTGESVGKKIRNAQLLQVNYMLTVGDREIEGQTVTVRRRDNIIVGALDIDTVIHHLRREMDQRTLSPQLTAE